MSEAATEAKSSSDENTIDTWSNCVSLYGLPSMGTELIASNESSPQDTTTDRIQLLQIKKTNRDKEFWPATSLQTLQNQDVDLDNFVKQFFGDKSADFFLIEVPRQNMDSDQSDFLKLQIMSENLLSFIKIGENLEQERRLFINDSNELYKTLRDFESAIHENRTNIMSFFDGILTRSKMASDSTALHQRISIHRWLFTMSEDIDAFKKLGDFESISRLIQRRKRFSDFASYSLYNTALHSVDKSLKNVEISLKEKVCNMTVSTFNQKQISLLMELGHPIDIVFDVFKSLDSRITLSLDNASNEESCLQIQDSLCFWCLFLRLFQSNYSNEYSEISDSLLSKQTMLVNMIQTRCIYKIESSYNKQHSKFSRSLHGYVSSHVSMWNEVVLFWKLQFNLIEDDKCIPGVTALEVIRITYYNFLLTTMNNLPICSSIAHTFFKYLKTLLKSSRVFHQSKYFDLFMETLYVLLDKIYANRKHNTHQLIKGVQLIIDRYIKEICAIFDKKLSISIPKQNLEDIFLVSTELSRILERYLLQSFFRGFNNRIYLAITESNIDWTDPDLSFQLDTWTIETIDSLINCYARWSSIFVKKFDILMTHTANSIYQAIRSIPNMSQSAKARFYVNVEIIKKVTNAKNDECWKDIEDELSYSGPLPNLELFITNLAIQMQSFKEISNYPTYLQLHSGFLDPSH